ncbi:MAG: hypothetical protein KGL39_10420 [Patescibacteria group bacterium]|nr:hypothetical protein [Patescibacteria group bacterium]
MFKQFILRVDTSICDASTDNGIKYIERFIEVEREHGRQGNPPFHVIHIKDLERKVRKHLQAALGRTYNDAIYVLVPVGKTDEYNLLKRPQAHSAVPI